MKGLKAQMTALDVDTKVLITTGLSRLASECPEITFGTACSGSDVLGYVLETCVAFYKEQFGADVSIRHCFSCEGVDTPLDYGQFQAGGPLRGRSDTPHPCAH